MVYILTFTSGDYCIFHFIKFNIIIVMEFNSLTSFYQVVFRFLLLK